MSQKKLHEIPRRKKNYSNNSHLLTNDIFNTFEEKDENKAIIHHESQKKHYNCGSNFDSNVYKFSKLSPFIPRKDVNQARKSSIKIDILNTDVDTSTANHNYNVLSTDPGTSCDQKTPSAMANKPLIRKLSGKIALPPLTVDSLDKHACNKVVTEDLIKNSPKAQPINNVKKSRNLSQQLAGDCMTLQEKKPIKEVVQCSFSIENNSHGARQFESYIERNLIKPDHKIRFLKLKKDFELEDFKLKNYVKNVLAPEREKEKEYEEFLKKNMISVKRMDTETQKELKKKERQSYLLDLKNQVSQKKNSKVDKSSSIFEAYEEPEDPEVVRKNQDIIIKKYYKQALLKQMIDNIETKMPPVGNLKVVNMKKLNYFRKKLNEEGEGNYNLSQA